MSTYQEYKAQALKDAQVKEQYDALSEEYALIDAMIEARQLSGMTQKQLAEKTGITQGNISRIESGNANPSLKTLTRLAAGMGMQLQIRFVPVHG